jgi:hypothetical protein
LKFVNYHLLTSHSPVFLSLDSVAFKEFNLSNFLHKAQNIVVCPLILTIHDLRLLRIVFVNDLLLFSNFSSFTFIFLTKVFIAIKCFILAALFQHQVIFIFFIIYLEFFVVLNFILVFIFLNWKDQHDKDRRQSPGTKISCWNLIFNLNLFFEFFSFIF